MDGFHVKDGGRVKIVSWKGKMSIGAGEHVIFEIVPQGFMTVMDHIENTFFGLSDRLAQLFIIFKGWKLNVMIGNDASVGAGTCCICMGALNQLFKEGSIE